MARTTQTKPTTTSSTTTVAPSAAPTSTSTEVKVSAPAAEVKAAKPKKEKAAPAPAPVATESAPPAVVADVATESAPVATESAASKVDLVVKRIDDAIANLSALKKVYLTEKKAAEKELKAVQKLVSKKKKAKGENKNSGFKVPVPISPELAAFLGLEAGTEVGRSDVSHLISEYVKANNLGDKKNIKYDEKLFNLLKLPADFVLSYFNIQKSLKHHIFKKVKVAASAPAPASA